MTQPLLPSKSLQPLFLVLVLVLVLVLGLLVRKAIEDDDEDEHDKEAAGFFLIVLVVVVVLGLPGEESNRGRRRGRARNCRMPQSARPMILWGLRRRPAITRKASAQVG
jgi:hypothetical protein